VIFGKVADVLDRTADADYPSTGMAFQRVVVQVPAECR
jgi:hypothetical protein